MTDLFNICYGMLVGHIQNCIGQHLILLGAGQVPSEHAFAQELTSTRQSAMNCCLYMQLIILVSPSNPVFRFPKRAPINPCDSADLCGSVTINLLLCN